MREKKFGILFMLIAVMTVVSAGAFALPTIEYIKINGDEHLSGDRLVVERGDELSIRVKLTGIADEANIEIRADILGYEYNDIESISDSTHNFDINEGNTVYKNLAVKIPSNAEKDNYDLRIRIGGRTGASFEGLYSLDVKSTRHNLQIRDVVLSPEGEVIAGRALLAIVRIKNYGEMDEESIRVRVSIPALGISASDYIDEIREDKSVSSEELYLRIPACIKEGTYTVRTELEYDYGTEKITKETSIRILKGESCETEETSTQQPTVKTTITVGSTVQDVAAGAGGAIYPISIHNAGTQSKAYTLSVDGADSWATIKMTPSNTVVVGAGETKSIYIYLSANDDATAGERMFSVAVKSDGETLKDIPLKANVASEESEGTSTSLFGWDKLKRGLEVGLIVLVVLLVILALIIGLNKLRGDKDDEEGQTYY